ncbi:MAG: methyltransferase domain-containing protein [Nitrospirae bacterium]|nr:MAG: methyltransferase domain-containing protein [Nitrospirota bacterium]
MHNIASQKAESIIDLIKIKGKERVLDLGGGPGTYSLSFAKRGCMVVLFDLPETLKIAREYVKHEKNITLKEGDFLYEPIGKNYDLVFVSNIIHIFGIKENTRLIRKISRSLRPGGRVVIHDFYLKKDRTTPVSGSLFSVNMLVNTPNGRAYSLNEIKEMLRDGGFRSVTSRVVDTSVLVTARR